MRPKPPPLIEYLASRIQILTTAIETALYTILQDHNPPNSVTIVTLPHNCGGDHERISVLQPLAWQVSGAGSFYDPIRERVMQNCVGAWEGNAHSLRHHIANLVTAPCFLGFHAVVIVAILFSVIMGGLSTLESEPYKQLRLSTVIIIPAVALLYDLVAMAFVIVMDVYFPDEGDPRAADRIQAALEQAVTEVLGRVGGHGSTVASTGERIAKEFYPKAVEALNEMIKENTTAAAINANQLTWRQMEAFLIVYRFVRGVSESAKLDPENGVAVFEDGGRAKRVVEAAILTAADDQTHLQLLRLLYKAFCPAQRRASWIRMDRYDLALNHYFGQQAVRDIAKNLPGKARRNCPPQRKENVLFACAPLEGE
jgi:hypothetical protein